MERAHFIEEEELPKQDIIPDDINIKSIAEE